MTINLAHFWQFFSGSGQILLTGQFNRSPGLAKIAPWWLARRDYFLAKVPGLKSADGATNIYYLNRRAVRLSNNLRCLLKTKNLLFYKSTQSFVS